MSFLLVLSDDMLRSLSLETNEHVVNEKNNFSYVFDLLSST